MTGAERIATERRRQMEQEGWTPDHDDGHRYGDLAVAAAVLACDWTDAEVRDPLGRTEGEAWPAQLMRKHGLNRFRQLEIAGALIAAEIDRLQRIADSMHPAASSRLILVPVRKVTHVRHQGPSVNLSDEVDCACKTRAAPPSAPLPSPTPALRSGRWAPVRANGREALTPSSSSR